MLPCTQSRRRRGRGDPAGGWAGTPTDLWTTSVTPARQRSSAPTADRWADFDLTRPRSYRADDSPAETEQEESTEGKETTALCLLNMLWRYTGYRIYLRVEQEAAWSGHWGGGGGARYRHGDSLADQTVPLSLCLFPTTAHRCPLWTAWPAPLVMGL